MVTKKKTPTDDTQKKMRMESKYITTKNQQNTKTARDEKQQKSYNKHKAIKKFAIFPISNYFKGKLLITPIKRHR